MRGYHSCSKISAEMDWIKKLLSSCKTGGKKPQEWVENQLSFQVEGQRIERGHDLIASVLSIFSNYYVPGTVLNM